MNLLLNNHDSTKEKRSVFLRHLLLLQNSAMGLALLLLWFALQQAGNKTTLLIVLGTSLFGIILFLSHYVVKTLYYPLQQAKARLATLEKNDANVELAKKVAHDIRSPLAALRSVVSTLQVSNPEKQQILTTAIQRINTTAENLLKANRESVSEPRKNNPQPLLPLITNLIKEKQSEFRFTEKHIKLNYKPRKAHRKLFVAVEPTELLNLLSNVFNNAFDAIAKRGIIQVELLKHKHQVELCISDNGKGIPEELLPHITDYGVSHDKEAGNGLGLFHAKQYVESLGGSIRLQSKVGCGTSVTILLPLAKPPMVPAQPETKQPPAVTAVWSQKVVHLSKPAPLAQVDKQPASSYAG